ncbi:stealth family protein [Butyrivibrio sp. AE3004]|uniref:stealth family protein n=1 Tax=Butyrivibrio sp. AE3004 TaxID=1506994 RepID=UPI0004946A7A|nr:stealth family protein [Butyrivibrio sp. AE3004]
MKKKNSKIDIVIPWVDGSDPLWLSEKRLYDEKMPFLDDSINSNQRYRDWGLMRYWFRGIEKNMPFINKIFFVTWGHVPDWLNIDHEKLVIIKHKDYIPDKYLPTYNSNVIELNLHRIEDLSENFILFNDDVFVISQTTEDMFYKNNLPCDMPQCEILFNYDLTSVFEHIVFNNLGIINKHFGEQRRPLKAVLKWVSPIYGRKIMLSNLNKLAFKRITGFKDQHLAIPHKKSVFQSIWELENENLDRVCMNRYRTAMDISTWLMKYWNLVTGNFTPINTSLIGEYLGFQNEKSLDEICNKIVRKEKPILVINDTIDGTDEQLFFRCQKRLVDAFERILPEKSSYEKY